MEKASTPKNRLTRSAAKQVNSTPKPVDQEENLNTSEDLKHNLRKSRRKTETKFKTNGDTSTSCVDNKKMKNIEDISDGNSLDDYESEDSNVSTKQKMSPKASNQKTPPTISRKSLRTRRSMTPGPELESSASKKMKRSTSEGKLESISTPTNRRGGRAKSESKDFVFTPSKCKTNGKDTASSLSESNSKYIHRNSALRMIDKIDETNEEDPSHEELEQRHTRKSLKTSKVVQNLSKKVDLEETISNSEEKLSDASAKDLCSILQLESVNHAESEIKTDTVNSNGEENMSEDRVKCQSSITSPQNLKEVVDGLEQKMLPEENIPLSESSNISLLCDSKDLDKTDQFPNGSEDKTASDIKAIEEPLTLVLAESSTSESGKLLQGNSEVTEIEEINSKSPPNSDIVDLKPSDTDCKELNPHSSPDDSQTVILKERHPNLDIERPVIIQSVNIDVSENNNVSPVPEQSEDIEVLNPEENLMDSEEVDVIPETVKSPVAHKYEQTNVDSESVAVSESDSAEPSDETEINEVKGNDETTDTCIEENVIPIQRECVETDERDLFQKTDEKDNCNEEVNTKQGVENLQEEVVIEDSENSLGNENVENQTNYLATKTDEGGIFGIPVENPRAIIGTENAVVIEFSLLKNEKSPNTVLIQETNKTEILDEYGKEQFVENSENTMLIKMNDQDETEHESNLISEIQCEPQLEDNFDDGNYHDGNSNKNGEDNFDDENINKNEEGSGSDCDIYKGLSDFGTDGEEKKDGSQYDDSVSTEVRSGDSEEDISSVEEEEEEEEEENMEEENVTSDHPKNSQNDQKINQEINSKVGEKIFDTSSPMTYDKALAILNKNRVKKIDDEEFFDMFTQELNRVSEESGSDSDIAIVDEYIMEPEEPPKKPNPKTGNPQANLKPAQNPRPPVPNQPLPPSGSFAGQYNQQVQPPQSRSGIPRANYSQGGLYHQYNQGMPPIEAVEGPVIYSQYAPHAPGVPDPRMYHPHAPPDGNFRAGMYNHPLAHVNDGQIRYSNATSLKVRNMNVMNSSQFPMNQNYNYPDQAVSNVVEINTTGDPNELEENMEDNMRTNTAAITDNNDLPLRPIDQDMSRCSVPKTPILDLLGLDIEKLKLLKKALGIDKETKKAVHRNKLIEHLKKDKFTPTRKSLLSKKVKKYGKKRHRHVKVKDYKKNVKRPVLKQILLLRKILSDPSLQHSILGSSSEHSSGESASSCESLFLHTSMNEDSNASSSVSDNRKVNIEDGSFSVTINTGMRKPRHRSWKRRAHISSGDSSTGLRMKQKNYPNQMFDDRLSHQSSDAGSLNRKMTQEKKKHKKQSTIIKSNVGTFTVDPLTTSQSSDSEFQYHDDQAAGPSAPLEKLRRSMKRDIASGKNKLSNLFGQHSLQQSKKSSKRKVEEAFGDSETLVQKQRDRVRKLKKLPTELLEKLAKEGRGKWSQTSDSGSEEVIQQPRKARKRAKKITVKSAMADQDYIPCVTGGATQFQLSRLDRSGAQAIAERAARYRTDHLYGADVKRITILDFKG